MIIGIEANHANKEQRTGVENYCWQMINNLKKQIPSDVRVILYSQKPLLPGLTEDMPKNWELKILKWPFAKLWSQTRLSLEMILNPPDIFFAPGQLIPFGCPKNTVVTVHDSAFMFFPEAYSFLGKIYLKWMNKRIAKVAKKILTPSQFSKNEFIKLYKFSPENIIVTPLGYDKNVYFSAKESFLPDLSFLPINKNFIFYVGRLEEKKNVISLLRAFEKIKENNDIALVLAGKPGYGFEKIEKAVNKSGYKKDIILTGWLSDKQIAACFRKCLLFVFPSFYEGFGIPLIEAMACGCPVLAAKGNSLEEVGGENYIYFDPKNWLDLAEKMGKLLKDDIILNEFRQSGLKRADNFSWQKTANITANELIKLQN